MYYFNNYVYEILKYYRAHIVLEDTISIGFTGVATQRVAPVFSNENSEDALYVAASVDFTAAQAIEAQVRIKSVSPQYEWMANDDDIPIDTPVGALAGIIEMADIALEMEDEREIAEALEEISSGSAFWSKK